MHKKDSNHEKHEFAFFCKDLLSSVSVQSVYTVTDSDIVHRMVHVVRIEVGDIVVLFNEAVAVAVRIENLLKKSVVCTVVTVRDMQPLLPEIHWYLPLLDRTAFDDAVYILTSMGATTITPLITEKSDKRFVRPVERLERIMIAAAEQSKQLVLPTIKPVEQFLSSGLLNAGNGTIIFFDPEGIPAFDVMTSLRKNNVGSLTCVIGPEGDLTVEEKAILRKQGTTFCALTPTILRAEQAVTVAMGMLRSCGMPGA